MENVIKIDGDKYDVKCMYDSVNRWIIDGELIELRKGEFFWTKKHFVKMVLGLSKIYPFLDRTNFYLLAFRIQFTNIYDRWLESRMFPNIYKI